MDVAPTQIVSAAAALIPFLEHDDANRALMGSNMQRQAVPLLRPQAPIVGTGMEEKIARDSRTCIVAERSGIVESVTGESLIVQYDIEDTSAEALTSFTDKRRVEYKYTKFLRTNQDTSINQKPIVKDGQRFKKDKFLQMVARLIKVNLRLEEMLLLLSCHGEDIILKMLLSSTKN